MAKTGPRPNSPTTSLGIALRARRGEGSLAEAAGAMGIGTSTLNLLDLGRSVPSYDTAVKLAAWLGDGWDVHRVMREARTPTAAE